MALFWRQSKSSIGVRAKTRTPSNSYHAVETRFRIEACEAVRQLEGKRFLSNDAPRLPLPDCTLDVCTCRYVHFTDRRSGEERRDEFRNVDSDSLRVRSRRDRRHA